MAISCHFSLNSKFEKLVYIREKIEYLSRFFLTNVCHPNTNVKILKKTVSVFKLVT